MVGWTHENEVRQGEEMPGVRPADEEERSDREGGAALEVRGLLVEFDDAAGECWTGPAARRLPRLAARPVFLQIGVHSMGTIFQQHRRLVSSRNCVVGSAAFFLVIWS